MSKLGVPDYLGEGYKESAFADKAYTADGVLVPRVVGQFYSKEEAGMTMQVEVYKLDGEVLYCAWGFSNEKKHRANAVMERGTWTEGIEGDPRIEVFDDGVGFKIKKTGGQWQKFSLKGSFF